jgi:hypothetical protein
LLSNKPEKKSELLLAEERQQLDLFQKIAASREFSPLVAAARREQVDGEALRAAVIRAMELMISRLDQLNYENTKANLQKALMSLKSEFIIF